jgi:hypothetical protein
LSFILFAVAKSSIRGFSREFLTSRPILSLPAVYAARHSAH